MRSFRAAFGLGLGLLFAAASSFANTYTVTSTADSGAGTLRQAVLDANANAGPDNIHFNIAGSGVHTITLASPPAALPPALAAMGAVLDAQGRLVVRYRPTQMQIAQILDAVRAADLAIADLATREADLEELFLRLTAHPATADDGL